MLKRHEVEVLVKAGHGKTEEARISGVSLRSVKRIAQEEPVVHVDDKAERNQRQIGRPSTVQNFRKQVVGILQETPDLPSLEILRRVREAGYQGGKTALYDLVASPRPKPARPLACDCDRMRATVGTKSHTSDTRLLEGRLSDLLRSRTLAMIYTGKRTSPLAPGCM